MPIRWKAHKPAQKDVDAKWTKKHDKSHFGYKLHASIDKRHELVRKVIITNAAVANTSRDVYADRGCPSAERETTLTEAGWRVLIQRKGSVSSRFPRRRSSATGASPRRGHASSTSLAPCATWAESWCAARGSCAPPSR
jgi:IS5 family transposase